MSLDINKIGELKSQVDKMNIRAAPKTVAAELSTA
jgi:hypothetical protein